MAKSLSHGSECSTQTNRPAYLDRVILSSKEITHRIWRTITFSKFYLRHAGPLGTNTEFFTLYEIFAKLCRPTLLMGIDSILLGEKIARVRAGIPDSDHTELLSLNLDLISLQGIRLDRTPFWIGWPTSSDGTKPLSPYILVFTIVSRRDKVWCNMIGIRAPGDLGPEASNSEVDPVIVVTETLFRPPGRLLIGLVTKHPPASSFSNPLVGQRIGGRIHPGGHPSELPDWIQRRCIFWSIHHNRRDVSRSYSVI